MAALYAGVLGTNPSEGGPAPKAAGVPAVAGLQACPASGKTGFSHWSLGNRFRDLKLSSVLRNCEKPGGRAAGEPAVARDNSLAYVYGSCKPAGGQDNPGCFPPVTVTNAPACERNLSLYSRYPDVDGKPLAHRRLTIRGVPAASFFGGRQVEVYTGDTTVTVEGEDRTLVRAAAASLRPGLPNLRVSMNQNRAGSGISELRAAISSASGRARQAASSGVAPRAKMARPVRGALAGKTRC